MSALTPTEPAPDTDPRTKARERIVKRLTAMAVLAVVSAALMIVLLGLGFALVLTTQARLGDIAVFSYGLVCLIDAAVFLWASGGLFCHHSAGQSHLHTADTLAQMAAQLSDAHQQMNARLAAVEDRLARVDDRLDAVAHIEDRHAQQLEKILQAHQDQLAQRRDQHGHEVDR